MTKKQMKKSPYKFKFGKNDLYDIGQQYVQGYITKIEYKELIHELTKNPKDYKLKLKGQNAWDVIGEEVADLLFLQWKSEELIDLRYIAYYDPDPKYENIVLSIPAMYEEIDDDKRKYLIICCDNLS